MKKIVITVLVTLAVVALVVIIVGNMIVEKIVGS
jgi:hypothetical protein